MNYSDEQETDKLLALSELPEPLRLAAHLEETVQFPLQGKAADELRRLHAENEELRTSLTGAAEQEEILKGFIGCYNSELRRLHAENEALRRQLKEKT